MASGGSIRYVLDVDTKDAEKIKAVTAYLNEMGLSYRKNALAFGGSGGGFGKAAKDVDGLAGAFQRYRREQVQQGRLVGFYVRELTEFTGLGKEAQGAVAGLGSVLLEGAAGGLSFGLAMEAVKFAINVVSSEMKRAAESARLVYEAQQLVNEVSRTAIGILEEKHRVETEGAQAGREAAEKFAPALAAIQEKYDKLREAGPGVYAWIKMWSAADKSGLDEWNSKLGQIADEIHRMVQEAKTWKEVVGADAAGFMDVGGRRVSPEEEKRALDAVRKTQEEEDRKRQEAAARAKRLNVGPEINQFEVGLEKQLYKEMEDGLKKDIGDGGYASMWKNVYFHGGDNTGGMTDQATNQFSKGFLKDAKAEADDFQASLDVLSQKGALIGDTFSSLGTTIGAAFGEAAGNMTAMFGKLIQQAIQLAVAMSATAGPLGWLNVAASAAAIMATIASVPEMRAAGGSVSAGKPYIVGELGPELFVPSGSGSIVPNNKLGGGGTTVINISATDPRSFEDYLERNADRVISRLNSWSRDRRI